MRFLGAVLVILSGLSIGLKGAGDLRRREAALLDWKQMIQFFRTGISYSSRPLAELAASCGDSRFCRLAKELPCFQTDPRSALLQAGERLLKHPADLELYRGFTEGLGVSGVTEQLEHLELYADLLDTQLCDARESREKRSRLSVCLGLFGGVTVCLVLI